MISYLQNHGPSTTEDIIASAPISHILEEVLAGLQHRGHDAEEDGYWRIQKKKYDSRKY